MGHTPFTASTEKDNENLSYYSRSPIRYLNRGPAKCGAELLTITQQLSVHVKVLGIFYRNSFSIWQEIRKSKILNWKFVTSLFPSKKASGCTDCFFINIPRFQHSLNLSNMENKY
jgi:hypothetical protein